MFHTNLLFFSDTVSEVVVDVASTKFLSVNDIVNDIAEEHNYCLKPESPKIGM